MATRAAAQPAGIQIAGRIPLGPWMLARYAILVGGGLLIALELRLLGLELGFLGAFAGFAAHALALVPDHCMVGRADT